jgi:thiazole synthase ThiGH ThiG subunit
MAAYRWGDAKELLKLGVSSLVIGSAILRAKDPIAAVEAFEALRSPYGV